MSGLVATSGWSTWASYSLPDLLLFSPRTYERLIALHNAAHWPLHALAFAAGLLVLMLVWRRAPSAGRVAGLVLAAAWLAVGWRFHLERFAGINWAAPAYAAVFALQAVLLATLGWRLRLDLSHRARVAALVLLVLALVGWPLLAPLRGQPWTQAEVFGLLPDPTVLATLALLPLWRGRAALLLWPLPLAWCVIGAATAWLLGSPLWPLLPATAALAAGLALRR